MVLPQENISTKKRGRPKKTMTVEISHEEISSSKEKNAVKKKDKQKKTDPTQNLQKSAFKKETAVKKKRKIIAEQNPIENVKSDTKIERKNDVLSSEDTIHEFETLKSNVDIEAISYDKVVPIKVVQVQSSTRKIGMCPVCNRFVCSSIDPYCKCGAMLMWGKC